MAGPLASNDVMISVEGALPSDPYVRMTLAVMEAFGAAVVEDQMRRFIVPAPQAYSATRYAIEPDASAASYFFAAAGLTGGRITVEGLGAASVQGDLAFVRVERMGCRVAMEDRQTTVWGPKEGAGRRGYRPGYARCRAYAGRIGRIFEGLTRIQRRQSRIKESDRLAALATELAICVPTESRGWNHGGTRSRPVAGTIIPRGSSHRDEFRAGGLEARRGGYP
jgi:3-phosphoshikimate 1-carboxyvinyltransferase